MWDDVRGGGLKEGGEEKREYEGGLKDMERREQGWVGRKKEGARRKGTEKSLRVLGMSKGLRMC